MTNSFICDILTNEYSCISLGLLFSKVKLCFKNFYLEQSYTNVEILSSTFYLSRPFLPVFYYYFTLENWNKYIYFINPGSTEKTTFEE